MDFDVPFLVRDGEPDLFRAEGKEPVVRFADDDEMRPLIGMVVERKANALAEAAAEAAAERVLTATAELSTAFRAYLRENDLSEEALASIAAQDGHAPEQLVRHAQELALATHGQRLPLAANVRRSLENFFRAAGITEDALRRKEDDLHAERGGYDKGTVVVRFEEAKTGN